VILSAYFPADARLNTVGAMSVSRRGVPPLEMDCDDVRLNIIAFIQR